MKPVTSTENRDILSLEMLDALGECIRPASLGAERSARLRERVLASVRTPPTGYGVAAPQGEWEAIQPGVEKKRLHVDARRGVESYLLRMAPGSRVPAHHHDGDEHCLCLSGDVSFDDVILTSGDYFFAPAGSAHGEARSAQGALLFLQGALAA